MKTIIEIEQEIKEFKEAGDLCMRVGDIAQGMVFRDNQKISEAILKQTKAIIKLIEGRIKYCKSQLIEDFEKDKIWKWRIDGFEEIISQIKGK